MESIGLETTERWRPTPRTNLFSGKSLLCCLAKWVILRETKRAMTPYGGAAVFIAFLGKIGLVKQVRRHMSIQWKSPSRIDLTDTFLAFPITMLVSCPNGS